MASTGAELCRDRPAQPDELDTAADVEVARRAAGHWGVLSLAELRACGLAREAVGVRVRNGRLHPLHRGVYAVGHANVPLEGRFLAAVEGLRTARGPEPRRRPPPCGGCGDWDGRPPEVTVPGSGTRRATGVRVHRARLAPEDRARCSGIPVTSPARTLVDLASSLPERTLRRAVRQAQSLRLVSVRHLLAALERAGPYRGRGRRAGGGSTSRWAPSGRPPHSRPALRLIAEAPARRGTRIGRARREALLEGHGERVLRVTWEQAVGRPGETLRRLRAAGAPPGRPPSPGAPQRLAPARHGERPAVVRLRRRVARVDVDAPVLDDEAAVVVVEADVVAVERPADRGRLPRLEPHPLEAAQPADRLGDAGDRVADVELGDLVARPRAGVRDVDARGDAAAPRVQRRGAQPQVGRPRTSCSSARTRTRRAARSCGCRGGASCSGCVASHGRPVGSWL